MRDSRNPVKKPDGRESGMEGTPGKTHHPRHRPATHP